MKCRQYTSTGCSELMNLRTRHRLIPIRGVHFFEQSLGRDFVPRVAILWVCWHEATAPHPLTRSVPRDISRRACFEQFPRLTSRTLVVLTPVKVHDFRGVAVNGSQFGLPDLDDDVAPDAGVVCGTHVRVLSPACSGFGLRGYTRIPFGRMKPQHARESVLWCLCDSRTRSATERSDDVRVGHFLRVREGGELLPSHALGLVESLAESLTHDPAVLPTAREVVPLGWLLRPRGGLRLGLRTRGGFRLRGRCRWCRRCTREKGEELIHLRVVVRELGFERSDTLGVGNACHGGSLSPACSGAYRETIALRAGDEDEQGGVPPYSRIACARLRR